MSFGVGRLLPDVGGGARWPFETVGAGFALLGIAFIGYAHVRQRTVEEALRSGRYAAFDERVAVGFTIAGVLLGIATMLLVVIA